MKLSSLLIRSAFFAALAGGPMVAAEPPNVSKDISSLLVNSNIVVAIDGSVAELRGSASSLDQAERAIAKVQRHPAVSQVVSRIEVSPGGVDREVQKQAMKLLREQQVLDAGRVRVAVTKGKATLNGEIGSLDEQELARELVSRVPGISEIENRLEVMFDTIRSDRQIASQIELMVADDPAYEGAEIKAHVQEGIVRLSGEIGSRELWDLLVSKSYVTGVFAVEAHEVSINRSRASDQVAALTP